MNQTRELTKYLKENHRVTRHIALLQFGIANLTAVISRVRQEGTPVETITRKDARGRPYAEYRVKH